MEGRCFSASLVPRLFLDLALIYLEADTKHRAALGLGKHTLPLQFSAYKHHAFPVTSLRVSLSSAVRSRRDKKDAGKHLMLFSVYRSHVTARAHVLL